MSLQTRLEALASAIGADIKADRTSIGTLSSLTTTAKSSLVAAINELKAAPAGGADPWTYQTLTAVASSSSTTTSDIVGASGFTPVANARYVIEMRGTISAAAATTGVQIGLQGPSTGITRAAVKVVTPSAAGTDLISHQGLNSWQGAVASLTTPSIFEMLAMVEVGATPGAGVIKPSWRSEVAASAVSMYPGSYFRWRTL